MNYYFVIVYMSGLILFGVSTAMNTPIDHIPFFVLEAAYAENSHEAVVAFAEKSVKFLDEKSKKIAPFVSRSRRLASGFSTACVDSVAVKCLGVSLALRQREVEPYEIQLDELCANGRKRAIIAIEPLSAQAQKQLSCKTQKDILSFFAQAVRVMYRRDVLLTERLYLWSTDSDQLPDEHKRLFDEYIEAVGEPMIRIYADRKPTSCCSCAIL